LEREFQWWRRGLCYKTSHEVEFGITSLARQKVSPGQLLQIRRSHWQIETGSHYRRDVTLKEDATRFTIGQGARVLANIYNLVLALIRQSGFLNAAQARQFFADHLSSAFSLLITRFSYLCYSHEGVVEFALITFNDIV
jgi:hypothetical protein